MPRPLLLLVLIAAFVGAAAGFAMRGEIQCSSTRALLGLVVISGVLGDLVTRAVWRALHTRLDRELGEQGTFAKARDWLPRWVGFFERALLTALVAIRASNVLAAAVVWMALKMAAGWQRGQQVDTHAMRSRAFAGLLCSLASLSIAAIGGFVCSGQIDCLCKE